MCSASAAAASPFPTALGDAGAKLHHGEGVLVDLLYESGGPGLGKPHRLQSLQKTCEMTQAIQFLRKNTVRVKMHYVISNLTDLI